MIPKTFGEIFCGLMRQKWNFMEGLSPVTSHIEKTQYFIKRTSHHGGGSVTAWGCFAALG